jgi:hypothetical protein
MDASNGPERSQRKLRPRSRQSHNSRPPSRDLGGLAARLPLWDVLRGDNEGEALYALGFDAEIPPPLFQAREPGVPDLSRPAIRTDDATSRALLAAVKRTFPMPAVDETVEVPRSAPFRTAFSALPPGLPTVEPRAQKHLKDHGSTSKGKNHPQRTVRDPGARGTVQQNGVDVSSMRHSSPGDSPPHAIPMEDASCTIPMIEPLPGHPSSQCPPMHRQRTIVVTAAEDVLPYVAYGPIPRAISAPLRVPRPSTKPARIDPNFQRDLRRRQLEEAAAKGRVDRDARRSPSRQDLLRPDPAPVDPLYVRMQRQWEARDAIIFAGDHAVRHRQKATQERRVVNRAARLALQDDERQLRREITADYHRTLSEIATVFVEVTEARRATELQDARLREERRIATLKQLQAMRAMEQLVTRQRAVRERAEWIVEIDRMKVLRAEATTRAKLTQLATESAARAKRRETARLELEALERMTTNQAAASPMERVLNWNAEGAPREPRHRRLPGESPSLSQSSATPMERHADTPHQSHATPIALEPGTTPQAASLASQRSAPLDATSQEKVLDLTPTSVSPSVMALVDMRDVVHDGSPSHDEGDMGTEERLGTLQPVEDGEEVEPSPLDCFALRLHSTKSTVPLDDDRAGTLRLPLLAPSDHFAVVCSSCETLGSSCHVCSRGYREILAEGGVLIVDVAVAEGVAQGTTGIDGDEAAGDCIVGPDGRTGDVRRVEVPLEATSASATLAEVVFAALSGVCREVELQVDIAGVMPRAVSISVSLEAHEVNSGKAASVALMTDEFLRWSFAPPLLRIRAPEDEFLIRAVRRAAGGQQDESSADSDDSDTSGADNDAEQLVPLQQLAPELVRCAVAPFPPGHAQVMKTAAAMAALRRCTLTTRATAFPLERWWFSNSPLAGRVQLRCDGVANGALWVTDIHGERVVVGHYTIDRHTSGFDCVSIAVDLASLAAPPKVRLLGKSVTLAAHHVLESWLEGLRWTTDSLVFEPYSPASVSFSVTLTPVEGDSAARQLPSTKTQTVVCRADRSEEAVLVIDNAAIRMVRTGGHPIHPFDGARLALHAGALVPAGTTIACTLRSVASPALAADRPPIELMQSLGVADASGAFYGLDGYLRHVATKRRVATVKVAAEAVTITCLEPCNTAFVHAVLQHLYVVTPVPSEAALAQADASPAEYGRKEITLKLVVPNATQQATSTMETKATSRTKRPVSASKLAAPAPKSQVKSQTVRCMHAYMMPLVILRDPADAALPHAMPISTSWTPGGRIHVVDSAPATGTASCFVDASLALHSGKLKLQASAPDGTMLSRDGDVSDTQLTFEVSHPRHLRAVLDSIQIIAADSPGVGTVTITVREQTGPGDRKCTFSMSLAVDVLSFQSNPYPAVVVPNRQLEYRQGSQLAAAGFPLLPDARVVLPPALRATQCDVTVELTSGGFGDGHDALEWIRSDGAGAVAFERGTLRFDSAPIGKWEESTATSFAITVTGRPDPASPDGPGALKPVLATDIAAVLHGLAYRNADPRMKAGARVFTIKIGFGREEPFRCRVTVQATPFVFSIPAFSAKVPCSSGAALPSLCAKIMVPQSDLPVPAASIFVQAVSGWTPEEDTITVTAPPAPADIDVMVDGAAVSITLPGTDAVVATGELHGRSLHLDFPTRSVSTKALLAILRAIGYANSGAQLSAVPRVFELYFEDPEGTACFGTVTVVARVPDLPATIDIGGAMSATTVSPSAGAKTKGGAATTSAALVQYTVDTSKPARGPMLVAPYVTVSTRAIAASDQQQSDTTQVRIPTLKVEFLHQPVPADALVLLCSTDDAVMPTGEAAVVARGDGAKLVVTEGWRIVVDGSDVATVVTRRRDALVVQFTPGVSDAAVAAVMQHVGYKHSAEAGARRRRTTRAQAKKVQLSFSPSGHGLWSRVTIPFAVEVAEES